MTAPFLGVLLAFAWFGASNIAASFIVAIVARFVTAKRIAEQPHRAARTLFALKVTPAAFSILFTAGVFLPAQWLWEPARSQEAAGYSIIVLALCGAAIVAGTVARAFRLTRRTRELDRCWRAAARTVTAGTPSELPVFFLRSASPLMSLAGIVRPRLFVADEVAARLTAEEFEVSLAHEAAHARSADNLKRMIAIWCPDVLGVGRFGRDLASRWRAATEFAADAEAVSGSGDRALALASALLKVARLATGTAVSPLAMSGIHHPALLAARVERLLTPTTGVAGRRGVRPILLIGAAVATTFVVALGSPSVWLTLHQATETLVRTLP